MHNQAITLSATILVTCTTLFPRVANAINAQPVEYFTRSLSALYATLDKCQHSNQDVTAIQAGIQLIRTYVSTLYEGELPYWTLPSSKQYISDPRVCNYMLRERVLNYEFARRKFINAYPNEARPPELNVKKIGDHYNNNAPADVPSGSSFDNEFDW